MKNQTRLILRRLAPSPGLMAVLGAIALVTLVPLVAESLKGGAFSLNATTTGGGGRAGGGSYAVDGAIGQASTEKSTGGAFEISGGLYGIVVVPGEVMVAIETTEEGQARLTWPSSAVGFQLQFAGQLGTQSDWKPVQPAPIGNIFVTPMNQPLRFFRLLKP